MPHSTIVTAVRQRPGACVGAPGGIVAQLVTQPDAGESAMTACLQSMTKLSSTVYGLVRSSPEVHLSAARSRLVGVGCGGHHLGPRIAWMQARRLPEGRRQMTI